MRDRDPEVLRLQRRAHAVGDRIGAPSEAYPSFDQRRDGGHPNVVRRDGSWVWEIHEHGMLLHDRSTPDEDEILYWIFVDVAHWMGRQAARDRPGRSREDSRAAWADRTLELLRDLDPRWLERFRREEASWLSTITRPGGVPPVHRCGARAPAAPVGAVRGWWRRLTGADG